MHASQILTYLTKIRHLTIMRHGI